MMQALGMGIITEIFPAAQRGRVMGIMGTAVSLGLAVGHPLGGLLVGTVGWRAIFFVNLPVCLLSWFTRVAFRSQRLQRPQWRALRRAGRGGLVHGLDLLRPGHDPGPAPRFQHRRRTLAVWGCRSGGWLCSCGWKSAPTNP